MIIRFLLALTEPGKQGRPGGGARETGGGGGGGGEGGHSTC